MEINKRILASIFVISILTFSLGYGTMSYFSDIETSTGNTFTAGTLDLTVNGISNPTAFFTVGDIKPGDEGERIIILHVTNDAWARVIIELKSDNGELDDYLELCFMWSSGGDYQDMLKSSFGYEPVWVTLRNVLAWTSYGTENDPDSVWLEIPGLTQALGDEYLEGCEDYYLKVMWRVPSTVGNVIQGDSVSVDVTFEVEQYKNQVNYPWLKP